MATSSGLLVSVLLLVAGVAAVEDLCSTTAAAPPGNRVYATCKALPQLSSSLHWTLSPSGNGGNATTLSLAFSAPPASPNGWVSWAINPVSPSMFGAQALIAFRRPDGRLGIDTFNISSTSIKPSPIDYEVSDLQAAEAGGRMWIFASVKLPSGKTAVNQVWQVGSSVTGGIPDKHAFGADNLASKGVIDLASGRSSDGGGARLRKANIHGVLNAVGWGILLPVGAIIARYLKTFKSADPAWFYLHVLCQIIGYSVGVAGWATGMDLGKKTKDFPFPAHRDIAIALFTLGTVQVFALFLRPTKDHKYRSYWNIYHHAVGYAVIVLGIINVFKGMLILNPDHKWKKSYIIVITVLGGIAVSLEAVTWFIFLRRKSSESTKLHDGGSNGHRGFQQPLTV